MKNGDHAIGLFQGMFEKNIHLQPGLEQRAAATQRIHGHPQR
jgi:hypothetical protein